MKNIDGTIIEYDGEPHIQTIDGIIYNMNQTVLVKCPWRLDIKTVTVPDSVVSISDSAFELCSMLKTIKVSKNVNHIGKSAFRCCRSLDNITIEGPITTIEDDTFSGCKSLTGINLPKTLKHIGRFAFETCSSLRYIYVPDEVLHIGENAFKDCRCLSRIHLPNSLRYIGPGAFINCLSLEQVSLPSSLSVLDTNLFKGCENLSRIDVPSSILDIRDSAFFGCTQLKTIKAPHVYSIGKRSFYQCRSLSHVSIPMVANIKDEAFRDCISLREVSLSDVLFSIGDRSFFNCNLIREISIPSSIRHMGSDCLPLTGHTSVKFGKKSKNDELLENVYYSDDPDSLIIIRPLQKSIICSICGTACFTHNVPHSDNNYSIQRTPRTLDLCPHCGYVSDNLGDELEFDWSVLNSPEYQTFIERAKKRIGIEGARALIMSNVGNHSLSLSYYLDAIEKIGFRLCDSTNSLKDSDDWEYYELLISTGLILCDCALLELEISEIIDYEKNNLIDIITIYRKEIELFRKDGELILENQDKVKMKTNRSFNPSNVKNKQSGSLIDGLSIFGSKRINFKNDSTTSSGSISEYSWTELILEEPDFDTTRRGESGGSDK